LGPRDVLPAVRAAQTIELAAEGAGMPQGAALAINWDRRLYLASSVTLIDVLRELDESLNTVLMVGHNPGLEDLIFDLVPDNGSPAARRGGDEIPHRQLCRAGTGCGTLGTG
jgi:phosphohistidine phosphatase